MIDAVNRRKLKKELMAHDFVLTELGLYLNSHPDDQRALQMHCEIAGKAEELRRRFVKAYGPIVAAENKNSENWDWVKGPWPWENQ